MTWLMLASALAFDVAILEVPQPGAPDLAAHLEQQIPSMNFRSIDVTAPFQSTSHPRLGSYDVVMLVGGASDWSSWAEDVLDGYLLYQQARLVFAADIAVDRPWMYDPFSFFPAPGNPTFTPTSTSTPVFNGYLPPTALQGATGHGAEVLATLDNSDVPLVSMTHGSGYGVGTNITFFNVPALYGDDYASGGFGGPGGYSALADVLRHTANERAPNVLVQHYPSCGTEVDVLVRGMTPGATVTMIKGGWILDDYPEPTLVPEGPCAGIALPLWSGEPTEIMATFQADANGERWITADMSDGACQETFLALDTSSCAVSNVVVQSSSW